MRIIKEGTLKGGTELCEWVTRFPFKGYDVVVLGMLHYPFLISTKGFICKGNKGKVLRLRKALYGLKQAPQAWYNRIDQCFIDQRFRRNKSEPTLYIKSQGSVDCDLTRLLTTSKQSRTMTKVPKVSSSTT
ncbi:hypothetical protein CR513_49665, partial [Mucuna pruriens]